jgi:hypothetical protein
MKDIIGRMNKPFLISSGRNGKKQSVVHVLIAIRTGSVVILSVFFSVLLLTSCQAPAWIEQYLRTPTPGEVLFQDDFSENTGTWQTWSGSGARVDYDSGGLRFFINEVNQDYWARVGKNYKDVQINVAAEKMSGPNNNQYGLICRYKNSENFYSFTISSDGYFGIVKVKEGVYTILNDAKMQYSEWIHQGEAANQLSVLCNADNLELSVNGHLLSRVKDDAFTSGDVGLLAGTFEEPGTDILFQHFVVTKAIETSS